MLTFSCSSTLCRESRRLSFSRQRAAASGLIGGRRCGALSIASACCASTDLLSQPRAIKPLNNDSGIHLTCSVTVRRQEEKILFPSYFPSTVTQLTSEQAEKLVADRSQYASFAPKRKPTLLSPSGPFTRKNSEPEQFPQPLGLSPANRNLGLLLVVHAQLIGAFEPGNDFADAIDIHQVGAMRPPKKIRV